MGTINTTTTPRCHLESAHDFQTMASGQNTQQGSLPSEVLQALSEKEPLLSSEAFPSHKSADVKSALDRLASRSMVTYETIDREEAILEPEAVEIEANGSHEARVFEAVRKAVAGLTISELEAAVGDKNVVKVGQGKAFKSRHNPRATANYTTKSHTSRFKGHYGLE